MELALLSGANPRVSKDGPRVRLAAGKWKIEGRHIEDTVVKLQVDTSGAPDLHPIDTELHLENGTTVQVIFLSRGTERYITVLAVIDG